MNKIYSKETNQKYIYIHTYIQGHIHIPIYIYFRRKTEQSKKNSNQTRKSFSKSVFGTKKLP